MKYLKKLGQFIRDARRQKGDLSLIDLAEKADVSYSVMQRVEAGTLKYNPEKEILLPISEALDLDYEDLVDVLYEHRKNGPPKPKNTDNLILATGVPIIPWESLEDIHKAGVPPLSNSSNYVVTRYRGKNLFALQVETREWAPFAEIKDILVIELCEKFSEFEFVLVYDNQTKKAEIKELERTRKVTLLKGVHYGIPSQYFSVETGKDKPLQVIGRICEVVRRLKHVSREDLAE